MSIDDQRYPALTLQSLRVTIGPLQASTTSLESRESYLTAGMLPYNRNVTLQTFLSSTRDFYRLHSTFARLYNAAASPASRLRSAGSLAINHTELLKNVFETIETSIIFMYCLEQIFKKKCFREKSLRFGQRFPSCHLLRKTTSKSATFEEQADKFDQQRYILISTCYKNETFTESRAIQI